MGFFNSKKLKNDEVRKHEIELAKIKKDTKKTELAIIEKEAGLEAIKNKGKEIELEAIKSKVKEATPPCIKYICIMGACIVLVIALLMLSAQLYAGSENKYSASLFPILIFAAQAFAKLADSHRTEISVNAFCLLLFLISLLAFPQFIDLIFHW
ncbi:hypothetical protein [Kushneria sp. TE3]|uniref:hypothetical protein n=1 Tax=Kushneria sp. TE3 TaxID=3449832 RepID=UPI003F682459